MKKVPMRYIILVIGFYTGIMYTAKLARFNTVGHEHGMTAPELVSEHNRSYVSPFEQRDVEARKERSVLIKYGCIDRRQVNHP